MIRFLAEANLTQEVVEGCRRLDATIDFRTANDELFRVPDQSVLALAAQEERILVTHDVHTTPHHFGEFLLKGNISSGVIIVRKKLPIAIAIHQLLSIWTTDDPEAWINRIAFLPLK